MTKITLYMAMSVNGYIAKENDETPWSDEVWKSYYEIAKKFKAIMLGRRTYEIMKNAKEFEKIGNPLTIVLSSKKMKNEKNTFFVKSPKEAILLLQKKGVKEAILGGGSKTNGVFMKDNLIYEIILDIEPLVLGKGVKLFSDNDFEKKLQLMEVKKLSDDLVQLHYKILRDKKV